MLNTEITTSKSYSEKIMEQFQHVLVVHPKSVLAAKVALLTSSFAFFRYTHSRPLQGLTFGSAVVLGTGLAYEWRHIFKEIWHGLLHRPYEPSFKPTFKEDKFIDNNQQVLATLQYSNRLPILTFNKSITDPSQRGYIHGKCS